jgi:hypothetical protein
MTAIKSVFVVVKKELENRLEIKRLALRWLYQLITIAGHQLDSASCEAH